VVRVTETVNSCRSLVKKVFENGHKQDRKGDRKILLTLILLTTYVICEEEEVVFRGRGVMNRKDESLER
jgi:hypothetical protein